MKSKAKNIKMHIGIVGAVMLLMAFLHAFSPLLVTDLFYCFRERECYFGWREGAPLRPFFKWHKRIFGDLANTTGVPQLREYRDQVTVTDEYGYRNAVGAWKEHGADVVLIGQSFGHGAGLSDGDHFIDQVRKDLHVPTYNYSPNSVDLLTRDSRFRKRPPKLVILFIVEGYMRDPNMTRFDPNAPDYDAPTFSEEEASRSFKRPSHVKTIWRALVGQVERRSIVSFYAEPVYKGLMWAFGLYTFPKEIFGYVPSNKMLLYKDGGGEALNMKDALPLLKNSAENIISLNSYWTKKRGVKFLAMILPRKETFYHDLDPRLRDVDAPLGLRYMNGMFAKAGVPHFNTFDVLNAHRQQHPDDWLYFFDDTHMNPRGHRVLFEGARSKIEEMLKK